MRLGKSDSTERLDAACRRALPLGACSYKSIESILNNGLDRTPLPATPPAPVAPRHANIRGPEYDSPSQREPNADSSHARQTPSPETDGDVSCPDRADANARDGWGAVRRTPGTAGVPREYRPGGSTPADPFAPGEAPANRLSRGYRLSPPTRVGQVAGAEFGHVPVDSRPAQRADHRAHGHWETLLMTMPS